jgi:hypothetical protein
VLEGRTSIIAFSAGGEWRWKQEVRKHATFMKIITAEESN